MKLKDVLSPSFKTIGRQFDLHVEVFEGRLSIWAPMWKRALSAGSTFCEALVGNQILTHDQMLHAVRHYRLGTSKSRGVIFWQIDHQDRIHDGKIMFYRTDCHRDKQHHPSWVSYHLQQRYQWPDNPPSSHCFFGLHLLKAESRDKTIVIVEAEKTAVILSEIYPQYLWMASGGLGEVQAEKFRPLRGRRIVLFPDTDPEGTAYKRWSAAVQEVHRQLWWEDCAPIYVSTLLEVNASEDQKQRKIDLADYWMENLRLFKPKPYTSIP